MITGDDGYVKTAVTREAIWRGVQRPTNKDVLKMIHE
jgi:hypothetical protein